MNGVFRWGWSPLCRGGGRERGPPNVPAMLSGHRLSGAAGVYFATIGSYEGHESKVALSYCAIFAYYFPVYLFSRG